MTPLNMTWISYPSKNLDFTSPEEIGAFIASQNIISRLMHCYIALFVPTGLIAGIYIVIIFIKNYLQYKIMENLDLFLLHFTISNIILILLSFTVITRPDYLRVTHLACNVLSFFFNFSYFNSQYVLVSMLLLLLLERFPLRTAPRHRTHPPVLCGGFVLGSAFFVALTGAVLVGTDSYQLETDCQLDPLFARPEYEIVKFTLGFGIPSFLQILCFIVLLAKAAPADAPALPQLFRTNPALYVTNTTIFLCRLFYNVMLLFRTTLKLQKSIGTPQNELVMNIAEIVLFCESCASLVFVLCFHKPCKEEILRVIHNCRRGNAASNHLEIPVTTSTPESRSQ